MNRIISFFPRQNYREYHRVFSRWSHLVLAVTFSLFLSVVPLLFAIPMTFSYNLPRASALTLSPLNTRITGFDDPQNLIQSSLDNLEKKKNIRLWVYLTSAKVADASATAKALIRNFTDKDLLLFISNHGAQQTSTADHICSAETCPITVQGHMWSKFSRRTIRQLTSELRNEVNAGEYTEAATSFADGIAASNTEAYHAPSSHTGLLELGGVVIILGAGGYTVYRRKNKQKSTHKLVDNLVQTKDISLAELNHYSDNVLIPYSQELIKSIQKLIPSYQQTLNDVSAHSHPQQIRSFQDLFSSAQRNLEESQQVLAAVTAQGKEINPLQRIKLVDTISVLKDTKNQLSENAIQLQDLEKRLNNAPNLANELFEKSIDMQRRIGSSSNTMRVLQSSYSASVLNSIQGNILQAENQFGLAKISLENAQKQITHGDPLAIDGLQASSEALDKVDALLSEIDNAAANISTAKVKLPERISQVEKILYSTQNSLASSSSSENTDLALAQNTLRSSLDYARENSQTDPMHAYAQLESSLHTFENVQSAHKQAAEQKALAQSNLRSNIDNAQLTLNLASQHGVYFLQDPQSPIAEKINESKKLLEKARLGLSPEVDTTNINQSIELTQRAEQLAIEANNLARSYGSQSYQYGSRNQGYYSGNNGFGSAVTGSFLGSIMGGIFSNSFNHYDNYNDGGSYYDGGGFDGSTDSGNF